MLPKYFGELFGSDLHKVVVLFYSFGQSLFVVDEVVLDIGQVIQYRFVESEQDIQLIADVLVDAFVHKANEEISLILTISVLEYDIAVAVGLSEKQSFDYIPIFSVTGASENHEFVTVGLMRGQFQLCVDQIPLLLQTTQITDHIVVVGGHCMKFLQLLRND